MFEHPPVRIVTHCETYRSRDRDRSIGDAARDSPGEGGGLLEASGTATLTTSKITKAC
jgi:hypothetical protein